MKALAGEVKVRAESPLVLVATPTLRLEQQAATAQACSAVGARALSWSPGQLMTSDGWPSLVVAGLPSGSRQLPAQVSELLQDALPRLPVLLLCEEPLLRPTMTSHGGRLVLLDPSCSLQLLANRVRMILTGVGRWRGDALRQAEQLHSGYWVGVCQCGESGSKSSIENDARLGLTVLFAASGARVPPALLDRVTSTLYSSSTRANTERGLTSLLGHEHAVIHLALEPRKWQVYFPWQDRLLQLHSPARAPCSWDFRTARRSSAFVELAAVAGDILLASTRLSVGRVTPPAQSGGPGVLDWLETAPSAAAPMAAGAVVELL